MTEDLEYLIGKVSELSHSLHDTGFILHGTVRKHYMKCGHKGCRCHADPPQLHGPYYDWTRRVDDRTKTVRLTEDQAKIIEEWINNMRRVKKTISEMEKISVRAAAEKIKK
ncbi:MAG: hypothetical protein M1477_04685 [Candidatus Thermoplasmatota archaeon]|nr:hypothetical protein [Candidatus Thermoplasmatota archaeon]